MDSVRKYFARLKTGGGSEKDDYIDENILNGPTIGISPGQVKEDVHYMESRGAIDLSHLRFIADYDQQQQSSIPNKFNFDIQSNTTNDKTQTQQLRIETFVDIAVFEVPEKCTSRNCDLSKFGVGSLVHSNDGSSYLELCQAGRLLLDHNRFKGHHTQLMIPSVGPMPDRIKQKRDNHFSMPKNRPYEVMLANCHRKGRHIHVMGQVVFDVIDGDGPMDDLTSGSMTILVSVAVLVFAVMTILAVRVNWGTQADFERLQYGLVPNNDESEQELSADDNNVDTQNDVEIEPILDDEEAGEP